MNEKTEEIEERIDRFLQAEENESSPAFEDAALAGDIIRDHQDGFPRVAGKLLPSSRSAWPLALPWPFSPISVWATPPKNPRPKTRSPSLCWIPTRNCSRISWLFPGRWEPWRSFPILHPRPTGLLDSRWNNPSHDRSQVVFPASMPACSGFLLPSVLLSPKGGSA